MNLLLVAVALLGIEVILLFLALEQYKEILSTLQSIDAILWFKEQDKED